MTLAGMIAADESALICDLAETYGIFDYRALPVGLLATLSAGLRENSRIKTKLAGTKVQPELLLLAAAVDRLSLLVWSKTTDAENGTNIPKSIVDILNGDTAPESDIVTFETAEEFEAARKEIIGEVE